jgi:hypothetical protein
MLQPSIFVDPSALKHLPRLVDGFVLGGDVVHEGEEACVDNSNVCICTITCSIKYNMSMAPGAAVCLRERGCVSQSANFRNNAAQTNVSAWSHVYSVQLLISEHVTSTGERNTYTLRMRL